ncbi:MAG: AI-2E family transporter [Phycisphaerales bacterium]|nr:AI-2E family transporter [Phycisphaerales bacterium]
MIKEQPGGKRYDLDRVVRLLLSAGAFVALIALARYLSDVLVPFVLALLIAYLLNPLVNALESRIKNRAAAVLVTVFGLMVIAVAGGLLLVPLVKAEINDFRNVVGPLRAQAVKTTDNSETADQVNLAERFDRFAAAQTDPWAKWILEQVREFMASEQFDVEAMLVWLGRRLAPGALSVLTGAIQLLLGLIGFLVVVLYVVFLLNDFRLVEKAWETHWPPQYREGVMQFAAEFRDAMGRYFRGQFIVASLTGVLFAVGFGLIELRMGVLLGLFIGVLNMVPYAQAIGLVPAMLLSVLRAVEEQSSIVVSLVWVLVVFAVVQLIQDTILTPRIVGKATGLRPAIILLSVFVWGKMLGFLGVVTAIPLTCLGLAYYRRTILRLKNS